MARQDREHSLPWSGLLEPPSFETAQIEPSLSDNEVGEPNVLALLGLQMAVQQVAATIHVLFPSIGSAAELVLTIAAHADHQGFEVARVDIPCGPALMQLLIGARCPRCQVEIGVNEEPAWFRCLFPNRLQKVRNFRFDR